MVGMGENLRHLNLEVEHLSREGKEGQLLIYTTNSGSPSKGLKEAVNGFCVMGGKEIGCGGFWGRAVHFTNGRIS